jgi:hypothetical protein
MQQHDMHEHNEQFVYGVGSGWCCQWCSGCWYWDARLRNRCIERGVGGCEHWCDVFELHEHNAVGERLLQDESEGGAVHRHAE